MKVAYVTNEFVTEANFSGGLANYIYRTCLALISLGEEKPHIIVASDRNETLDYNGIKVHRVDTKSEEITSVKAIFSNKADNTLHNIYQSLKLNEKLAELSQKENYDIVQYSNYTCTALYRLPEIPTVVRISSVERLWRGINGRVGFEPDFNIWYDLDIAGIKSADRIIGPSQILLNYLQEEHGIVGEKVPTPFIMDVDREQEDVSMYEKELLNSKYILFYGSLNRLKGIEVIEEAIYEILRDNPDLDFVFIGKDEGRVARLLENAEEYSDRVRYLGVIKHKQLYPIIRNARFVVLPSLLDNSPNTVIESMALGKIVIGSDKSSIDELITDGESGFLIENGNSKDLVSVINKCLKLSEDELKLIENNALEVIKRLRPDIVTKQLIGVYQEVISRHRAAFGVTGKGNSAEGKLLKIKNKLKSILNG